MCPKLADVSALDLARYSKMPVMNAQTSSDMSLAEGALKMHYANLERQADKILHDYSYQAVKFSLSECERPAYDQVAKKVIKLIKDDLSSGKIEKHCKIRRVQLFKTIISRLNNTNIVQSVYSREFGKHEKIGELEFAIDLI